GQWDGDSWGGRCIVARGGIRRGGVGRVTPRARYVVKPPVTLSEIRGPALGPDQQGGVCRGPALGPDQQGGACRGPALGPEQQGGACQLGWRWKVAVATTLLVCPVTRIVSERAGPVPYDAGMTILIWAAPWSSVSAMRIVLSSSVISSCSFEPNRVMVSWMAVPALPVAGSSLTVGSTSTVDDPPVVAPGVGVDPGELQT